MTSAPREAIEVVDMTQSQRREVSGPVDARSGRVVFVSHCLLNENVRYTEHDLIAELSDAGVVASRLPASYHRPM
jgi:hypothetical protein